MLGSHHGGILLGSERIKPKNDSKGIRMITDLVRLSAYHLPLKSIFKQLAAAFPPGVIRQSYERTKYQTETGLNMPGTANEAVPHVPAFLVVFGRWKVGFHQILCGWERDLWKGANWLRAGWDLINAHPAFSPHHMFNLLNQKTKIKSGYT